MYSHGNFFVSPSLYLVFIFVHQHSFILSIFVLLENFREVSHESKAAHTFFFPLWFLLFVVVFFFLALFAKVSSL